MGKWHPSNSLLPVDYHNRQWRAVSLFLIFSLHRIILCIFLLCHENAQELHTQFNQVKQISILLINAMQPIMPLRITRLLFPCFCLLLYHSFFVRVLQIMQYFRESRLAFFYIAYLCTEVLEVLGYVKYQIHIKERNGAYYVVASTNLLTRQS